MALIAPAPAAVAISLAAPAGVQTLLCEAVYLK